MEIVYSKEFSNMPYEVVNECKCMAKRKNKTSLEKSGLQAMLNKTFDNFVVRDLTQRKVKELAQRNVYEKNWFFIGGQSGFGKTHICSAISKDILNKGHQMMYAVWTKDFKELNFLQVDDPKKYKWKKRELETVDNLYIDDLFKNKTLKDVSNADIQLMFDVINHRYNNDLKTIISSEYDLQQLAMIDQAIAGRIKEKCGEFILNISKDIRNNQRLNGKIIEIEDFKNTTN